MLNIDMWYGDTYNPDTDIVLVYFCPVSLPHYGNIVRNGKYIGDFSGDDSVEISEHFNIKWND